MGRRSLSELRQLAQLAGRTRALAITLAAVVLVGSGCLRLGVPAPRPPPVLGAHTDELMRELGFAGAEIESVKSHAAAVREELFAALLGDN